MKPHPDVLAAHLADETVLLHLGSKRYFRLNRTGSAVWRALERGDDQTAILADLLTQFDVARDDASAALVTLIEQLIDEGLVAADEIA